MRRLISILSIVLISFFIITSCGGGGSGSGSTGAAGSADNITVSYDGGSDVYYNEIPSVSMPGGYDPWIMSMESFGITNILLFSGYNPGVAGTFEELLSFTIMGNTTGAYSISDIMTMYSYMGTNPYLAMSGQAASHGTINITRFDTSRIEGNFDLTMVDAGSNILHILGTFDLQPGITP